MYFLYFLLIIYVYSVIRKAQNITPLYIAIRGTLVNRETVIHIVSSTEWNIKNPRNKNKKGLMLLSWF